MKNCSMNFVDPMVNGYMSEECLYEAIESYAKEHNLMQTQNALPFAKKWHDGQIRKGGGIPYIYHPLMVAYHALSLGLTEDIIIATAILHDVCEDCGIAVEDLPVDEEVKVAVSFLTKTEEKSATDYYADIAKNKVSTMIKILDRINNVSDMAKGFSNRKMRSYITDTETHIYPLFQTAKEKYPEYTSQIFLMEYHMIGVVSSIKLLVKNG